MILINKLLFTSILLLHVYKPVPDDGLYTIRKA